MKKELWALLVLLALVSLAGVCAAYTGRSTDMLCERLAGSRALYVSGDLSGALTELSSARADFLEFRRRACLFISDDSLNDLSDGFAELAGALAEHDGGAAAGYERLICALQAAGAEQGLSPGTVF